MTDVQFRFRKGAGSNLDVLFGTVTLKPTLAHSRGTSMVLPAPSTWDIINGEVLATNVQPTPEPVDGVLEWGYEVTVKDRHGKSYSFLVGVPDSTTAVEFASLPRYFETKPPLFGQGPKGDAGEAATISVGSVTSGTEASVTNSGTSSDAKLDFVLPKGDKGDRGEGVPAGGTALQYIRKDASGASTEWATLDKTAVGLGNVDNTADVDKPVSLATQVALDKLVSEEDLRVSTLITDANSRVSEELRKKFEVIGSLVTSVKEFGAIGDGIVDDTVAIQTALDSGARVVFVPDGTYLLTDSIRVPANTTFFTFSATLKLSEESTATQFIQVSGSYLSSNDRELAVEVNKGARTLTTKTAHPYSPGDTLRLVGQRVSTNPDDAGDDQLGWATVGGQGPYFSEVVRVQNVPSPTTLVLDTGLIFNGYRPDKSQESDPSATSSAVLKKTNGLGDGVVIEGFKLEGEASYGIRVIRAKDTKIRRVSWVRNLPGRFIQLADAWYAEVSDCYIETRQWEQSDEGVDHAAINQYHTAGAWQSGFTRCFSIRGTQPFDFTYSSIVLYPSVYCYVRDSETVSSLHNPVTAHPGTYGISVLNNKFLSNQKAGISIRSNHSEVRGNTVVGSNYEESAGLYYLEGGGKNSVAADNIIENFSVGIRINDGANKPFAEKINIKLQNNTIRNFTRGFFLSRLSGRPIPSETQGIEIDSNRFETSVVGAIGILTCESSRGIRGLTISNNTFLLGSVATANNTAILVTANSKDTRIRGNNFTRVGTVLAYDSTGYLASGGIDHVLMTDSTRVSDGYESLPPDTQSFQITYDSPRLAVYTETDMNTMLSAKRFRVGSASAVSISKGFPVDNATGWGEIIPLTGGAVAQKFHVETTTTPTMWTRRITANSQSPWMKLSYS